MVRVCCKQTGPRDTAELGSRSVRVVEERVSGCDASSFEEKKTGEMKSVIKIKRRKGRDRKRGERDFRKSLMERVKSTYRGVNKSLTRFDMNFFL